MNNRPIRAARLRADADENADQPAGEIPVDQEDVQVDANQAFVELVANHLEEGQGAERPAVARAAPARQARNNNQNNQRRRRGRNQPVPLAESSSSESDNEPIANPVQPPPVEQENPLRKAVRAKKEWLGGFICRGHIILWGSPYPLL